MYGGAVSDVSSIGSGRRNGGVYIECLGSFNMYGGEITRIDGNYYGGVYSFGTFNMYGGEITENSTASCGGGIYISSISTSTFKMLGGIIANNTAVFGGGIYNDGNAEILGGKISDNRASKNAEVTGTDVGGNGGGILNNGVLKIENGNISNNYSAEDGGGIYNNVSSITICGGNISNNKALGKGGGIYTYGYCTIEISDAGIAENTAAIGGGIYNGVYSSIDITNTDISANTSNSDGGGLYAHNGSTSVITDSTISENSSNNNGGGVYLHTSGTEFTMNGGEISGNTVIDGQGGGIFAYGNPHVSGFVKITGNTADSADNNVFLYDCIVIEEDFDKESKIGVTLENPPECGEITEITGGESLEEHVSAFYYDNIELGIRAIWKDNNGAKSEVALENPHNLTNYPAEDPGCIKDGHIEFDFCSKCKHVFYFDYDELGNSIKIDDYYDDVKDDIIIPAIGHLDILEHIYYKNPTCTEKGNKEYWICERCGSKFGSEDGGEIIDDEDVEIAAKGHSMTHHDKVLPTCTEEGVIEYWECSECKGKFSDMDGKNPLADNIKLPELGHDLIYFKANEPTCTKEGNKEYWQCSRCGIMFDGSDDDRNEITAADVVIPVKAHIWETDYNQDFHWNICSVCGTKDGSSIKEHEYDGGKTTKPATCTNEGEITYTCEDCSHTKIEALRKLSHIIIEELQYNEDYHWEECRNCHQHLQEEVHKWDKGSENPDKNVKIYSCEKCGAEKTEALEPKPEKTTAQETEVTTNQETEVTTKQETEVTTMQESEVTTKQETEVTTTQESRVTTKQETEVTTIQESGVTTNQETEVTTMQETEVTSNLDTEATSVQETEITSVQKTDVTSDPSAETTQATSNVNNGNDNENNGNNMSTGIVISVIPMITALAVAIVSKRRR